jgi:hypothetical protein
VKEARVERSVFDERGSVGVKSGIKISDVFVAVVVVIAVVVPGALTR